MKIFVGTHLRKIDRNGRVSIPSRFRALLDQQGGSVVHLFPAKKDPKVMNGASGEYLEDQIARAADLNPEGKKYEHFSYNLFARVVELTIDKDGRIVLPPDLRDKMGIEDEVSFVGRGYQFSLMHPDHLEVKIADAEAHDQAEDDD